MHVLVIGGTRFVGYQLVWRLLAEGHRVTILNRGLHEDPFGTRVERIVADRASERATQALAARRFDAAVDFAAMTAADAKQAVESLGEGRVGHYIAISTGQVYLVRAGCPWPAQEADYDGQLIARPTDAYDLDEWWYGVHKREMEDVLARAWAEQRFPATRLRLPMVNGERDHFRRIESYLWRIMDGGPVLLPNGGSHVVRHVYSGAVVKEICALLGRSATFGEAYNLAQDETPTLAELVALVADIVGAPARLVSVPEAALRTAGLDVGGVSPFSDRWMSYLNPARAKEALGFQHEPLRTYLEKIVASLLNHPPAALPDNYLKRPVELEVAERVLAGRSE